MTHTATFIKKLEGFRGDARLYRLDPPINSGQEAHAHVVVSAVYAPFSGPETYIFPADDTGEIVDWGELDGSFRGGIDHTKALSNAGYEIVSPQLEA